MFWQQALLLFLTVWLLALSLFFFWLYRHLNAFTKEAKGESLVKLLDQLMKKEKDNQAAIRDLSQELTETKDWGQFHLQKMGIVRFNPFKDTGGDHSFSVALLDGKDTGLILTGLHTRERTRLYLKAVKKGKSEHDLSREEKEAVIIAQKLK